MVPHLGRPLQQPGMAEGITLQDTVSLPSGAPPPCLTGHRAHPHALATLSHLLKVLQATHVTISIVSGFGFQHVKTHSECSNI